jgi:hypothetical protein
MSNLSTHKAMTKQEIKNALRYLREAMWRTLYRAKRNIIRPLRRYDYRMRRYATTPHIVRIIFRA